MKNKFNATCARCGQTVLVGDGDTNLSEGGNWVTKHAQCPQRVAVGSLFAPYIGGHPEDDEFDAEFYRDMTSEDFNPNEGDK